MDGYRDLSGLTRIAAGLLVTDMVLMLVITGIDLYLSADSAPDISLAMAVAGIFLLYVVVLIAGYVVVGRWIYLASRNAHLLSDEMTISPGWAVGWYFIPVAHLFMPYQAMREIWKVSFFRRGWHDAPTPGILILWWTLWVTKIVLGSISLQLSFRGMAAELPGFNDTLNIAAAMLDVPLCLVVIAMTRRIAQAQKAAGNDQIFA